MNFTVLEFNLSIAKKVDKLSVPPRDLSLGFGGTFYI